MKRVVLKKTRNLIFFLLLSALAAAAYSRNMLWPDEFTIWNNCLKHSPQKWRPHYKIGLVYYFNGLPDKALEEFRIALDLKPASYDVPGLHNNIGRIYQKMGLFDEAKKEYGVAIEMDIKSSSAYVNMGTIYLETGDLKTALRWFLEAIKKESGSASLPALVNAGFTYGDLGEYQKAIEMHKKTIAVNPDYHTAHFGLALAYEGTGQIGQAAMHWEEYLRLAPKADEWRQEADKHLRRIREMGLR